MTVLLGASGYIGQAFRQELERRGRSFRPVSRETLDYANFAQLLGFLQDTRPELVINAAGFAGRPNVDACETARAETLQGNVLLPLTVAHACATAGIPWGHVSSGCIYSGAWVTQAGTRQLEKDLTRPAVRALIEKDPSAIEGFTELDEPNFSFRCPPCSFYSGAKALAEEALAGVGQGYLWRLRIPFDRLDHSKNYLSKIQRYPRVYDNVNSLSHREDFVRACLDLWERRAPFGTYNVTNPGFVTTRRVVLLIQKLLYPERVFEFFADDDEFYRKAAVAPRSNCVLDVSKLLATGVKIRPVEEAVFDSLSHWKPSA